MISRLEKEIIFRFLKTRKQDNFLNIITIFSFIGISLGVAVLIIVMSVMNGFRTELINKIVGFNSHLVLSPYEETIDVEKIKKKEIYNLIDNYFYTNKGEAVILQKNYTKGIMLRGYEKNSFKKLSFVNNDTFSGSKKLNSSTISIGKELSYILNADIGDKVTLMSPAGVETLVGNLPKQETFIINSIFDSGLVEFDQNVAFLNINDLESFFNLSSDTRDIEFYLINPENIENAKNIFQISFNDVYIYTWADLNKSLFSALKIERNVMFIILSLIIIVAAFNIISGLTILVKNKTKEIAILKSIGVLNKSISKIFFMVGFLIGSLATLFGIVLGILFSIYVENIREFLSNVFNISLFPEEIYFLSKMPSEINTNSIILIATCSILITAVVSIFPALKASRMNTVKALKYE